MIAHRIKTPIALLVILSIIFFSFPPPQPAEAQQVGPQSVTTAIIGGLGCTVGGTLSTWIVGQITKGLRSLANDMGKKLATFLGLTAFINPPKVPIVNPNDDDKQAFLDVAARCFAREIMNDITARMIGSVRTSGRDGVLNRAEPSFVRDWRRFLSNAQHRGENIFRSVLGSTSLCNNVLNLKNIFNANNQPPIADPVRTRVGNLNSFSERARCTMPQGWTLQNYTNDFAGNGGWDALVRLSEPQNNYYGALLLSLGELAAQRAHEETSDAKEAESGKGFTARRGKPGNNCLVVSNNGRCVVYKDIVTPGSVLGDTVRATIQEELAWITNVDEWNELIQYLMSTVMSRILNLAEPTTYDQEDFPRERYPGPWDGDTGIDIGGGSPPIPPGTISLCQDINYGGTCESFSASDSDLTNNSIGNDQASSIIVNNGDTVDVCTDINFGGICRTFTSSHPDFTTINLGFLRGDLNDKVSSIRYTAAATTCFDLGQSDAFRDVVGTAVSYVVYNNPSIGLAPNTDLVKVDELTVAVGLLLAQQGYRVGRSLDPNGVPYPQVLAIGNPTDPDATLYRLVVNIGNGDLIQDSIAGMYCGGHEAWSTIAPITISLSCVQQGLSDSYGAQVQTAINTVVNNTTLDDGSRDFAPDLSAFLDAVVLELRSSGLRAGRVNNGVLRVDTVIVGQPSDPDGTVYDIIIGAGDPGRIGDYLAVQCVDHGPWSWLRDPGGIPPGSNIYGINLFANGGQHVSAPLGGPQPNTGFSVIAIDTIPSWQDFILIDLNGGTLDSGDVVAIETQAVTYFSAANGGGSTLEARATNIGAWERFTIVRTSNPSGTLADGDLVSFEGSDGTHVWEATNGGGGAVDVTRVAPVGTWGLFRLNITSVNPVPPAPPPPPPPTPTPIPLPQCSDGIDNDNDNSADYGGTANLPHDPECAAAVDDDESQ